MRLQARLLMTVKPCQWLAPVPPCYDCRRRWRLGADEFSGSRHGMSRTHDFVLAASLIRFTLTLPAKSAALAGRVQS